MGRGGESPAGIRGGVMTIFNKAYFLLKDRKLHYNEQTAFLTIRRDGILLRSMVALDPGFCSN